MKTVIVTGASGNMGQAIVKKFLSQGSHVVGSIVANDPVSLDITDGKFDKMIVDLTSEDDSENFINTIIEKYKTIDVLVSTVGGFAMGSIDSTKAADIFKQYTLNFETAYHVARPVFVQMMKQKSGRIFLVGSKPGLNVKDSKGMVAYSLGKSLIFRLTELMNEEATGTNVVVSVLVPGTIDTGANRTSMPAADFSKWVKPEAIAEATWFYCTNAASSIREPVIKLYNNA